MPRSICPICRKQFDAATSDAPPFCGKRCREIDLGRWLGERYSFPASRLDDDEELLERDEAPETDE